MGQFANDVEAGEAWRKHRATLLTEWIAEFPGSRPYFWWEVERPVGKLRKQIAGPPPIEGAPIYRGYPSHWPHKCLLFETEVEFLARLNLLTREELRQLPRLLENSRVEQRTKARTRGFTEAELDHIFKESEE
jgi:hypothetical protein